MASSERRTSVIQPNFYRVLHVQPDAPVEIIRTSYRTLMQTLAQHPDLGGDTASAALINEAFETLRDPLRRAIYDQSLADEPSESGVRSAGQPDHTPHLPAAPILACLFCGEPYPERQSRRPDGHCSHCGSPLCPPPTGARSTDPRRGFHRTRLVVHVSCAVKGSAPFEGVTENASVAGLQLLSPQELRVDQIIRVDCEFCSAVGVVKYANEAARRSRRWWQVGIEFKTVHLKQMRGGLFSAKA